MLEAGKRWRVRKHREGRETARKTCFVFDQVVLWKNAVTQGSQGVEAGRGQNISVQEKVCRLVRVRLGLGLPYPNPGPPLTFIVQGTTSRSGEIHKGG